MNEVVEEWVRKAEGDFATANRELAAADNPNYDAACFHAQQCIEKLLKAAIIMRTALPHKTHDLVQLARQMEPHGPHDVFPLESCAF
ncbi:MAG: HEPN domain-containing protein [Candidatus Hydrogenedentes bacterium]|nr:HEPN domain-containing protein [Candidatus Hydrogenedentota bacterium]